MAVLAGGAYWRGAAMRALVFGGRKFRERIMLFKALDVAKTRFGITEICHGHCGKFDEKCGLIIEGADLLAGLWALFRAVKCTPFPADWDTHGKPAGPIRNRQMLDEFGPEIGLGFEGGPGSENMTEQLLKAGVPVYHAVHGRWLRAAPEAS